MIIKDKNYVFSRGVAFYPEKEMELLKEQLKHGWHFIKLNSLGFLVFEKGEIEDKKFSVDFFSGSKEELDEYLTIYEEAGWEYVADYKKKYYYFQAEPSALTIYSDEDSYSVRMRQEWLWNFKSSLTYVPIGLLIYFITYLTRQSDSSHGILYIISRALLFFFGTIFTVLPFSVLLNILFSMLFYKDRKKFFNRPEIFAKRQRLWRDLIILMFFGAIVGMILSFMFGDIA
ncbi:DUF2812 domain-containing protein [Enterococcus sp. BWB1-3]|uniref:DUF2812 domain-containing protein n=1 Tax=unclassified Enterococcus TaxID=2608891 RepID=UPI00192510AB|nr:MULTISPECIES: DUF2812 domain-containing protein [unclassified Enterococcus]MBL1228534.1 DUF2812 domain-containing protein [Enterococcus sp. BWB1-3]MCB5950539.1 DUF2812 domain-containing protein [Enterococcus sp. BWT-B8]MCB5955864.1 DUF2812 domain-containing protein [Enterococcus sp. CWB-B31]